MILRNSKKENKATKVIRTAVLLLLTLSLIIPSSLAKATTSQCTVENTICTANAAYDMVRDNARKKAELLVSQLGFTSIQYSLMKKDSIIFTDYAGYASIEKKKSPDNQTMYGIGSVSKLFTTVSMMQLSEKGIVNLDSPVYTYLPEFTMADERYKDITVRMLLNHSSGLRGNSLNNTLLFNHASKGNLQSFLQQLRSETLIAEPGSYSVYCNDGFTLAEILIEKLTKKTFTEYVKENICKPLGLTRTLTPQDSFKRTSLARSYDNATLLPYDYSNIIGAGGMYSTSEDLCKFLRIFNGKKNPVLSSASIDTMSQPEYAKGLWGLDEDSTFNYGLGWDATNLFPFNHYNITTLAKSGDTLSYHASVITIPNSELSVAVVSSGGLSTYNTQLATEILEDVLLTDHVIKEKYIEKAVAPTEKMKVPDYLKNYNGVYANPLLSLKINMTEYGVDLIYSADESIKLSFSYVGNKTFKDQSGIDEITFLTLANGKSYIREKILLEVPLFDPILSNNLAAVKLEDNNIDPAIVEKWRKQEPKTYFLLNEVYNSQLYLGCPTVTYNSDTLKEGYLNNIKILSETKAKMDIQLPGTIGRDLSEITKFYKNGYEYLQINSALYVAEEAVHVLPSQRNVFQLKIDENGYAKWYKTPKCVAGKTIHVTVPKEAGFAVYDSNGQREFLSTIENTRDIKLPLNGYLVFSGTKSSKFTITYK